MTSWDTTESLTIEELQLDDELQLPECVHGRGIDSVDIEFRSVGYYQAASMYGGPDHLGWPAEGDDERTMVSVKAFDVANERLPLSTEEAAAIFEAFSDEIASCESSRDEGREWDE